MPQSLDALIRQLDDLLESLEQAETDHRDAIRAVDVGHRRGAVNLVHYLTLRRHDVRALQNDLMDMGVTSLSTAEANVRAKVRAARSVLAALRGDPGPWDLDAVNYAIDHGDEILATNCQALFGVMRPHRPTRVMLTLPSEAAEDAGLVASYAHAGMDIARVNCAHDTPESWRQMAANTRAASDQVGRRVLVSMDLPGPKLRTGPIATGPRVGRARRTKDAYGHVTAPARIWLTPLDAPAPAPPAIPPAVHQALALHVDPAWLAARNVGDIITLRDTQHRRRSFTVSQVHPCGVTADGSSNAYVGNGQKLHCDGEATIAAGIPSLENRLTLAAGNRLTLTNDLTPVDPPGAGQDATIGCTLPQAISALCPGDAVLLDDGAITAAVESTTPDTATLLITGTKPGGQRLGAEKGINLPDTVIALPALTAEDDSHLSLIAEHADMVAVSFIRTAGDVEHVLDRLDAADAGHLGLILKIETRQGFENLPSILLAAMRHPRLGVMIARGDLAVEVGFERLAEIPRQILALCEAAHVPAIWATQVLETLAKTGHPTRAEITDAAAAQRADCVMLNKGPHILDAMTTLDDILTRLDPVQRKSRTLMRHIHSWDGHPTEPDPLPPLREPDPASRPPCRVDDVQAASQDADCGSARQRHAGVPL